VTVSVGAAPAVIARAFTIPQVTAGESSIVTPAAIARAFAINQVTVSVGAAPALVALAFTIPQVTPVESGGATPTPATIVLAFVIPPVTVDAEFLVDKPWKLLGGGPPIRGQQKWPMRRPGWAR
jgi:hypothetical protein